MRLALLGWTGESARPHTHLWPTHAVPFAAWLLGSACIVLRRVHGLVIFQGFQVRNNLCGLA